MKKTLFILFIAITATGCCSCADNRNVVSVSSPTSSPTADEESSSTPTPTIASTDDSLVDNVSDFSETEVSDKKVAILNKKLVKYDDEGKIIYKSQSLKYIGQNPELSYSSDLGELFLVTYDKPQTNRGSMYIYVFDKKLSKIKLLLRGITVCSLSTGDFYDSNRSKAWKYTKGKLKEVPYPKN